MQAVVAAKSSSAAVGRVASLSELPGFANSKNDDIEANDVLILRQSNQSDSGTAGIIDSDNCQSPNSNSIALAVDELIGAEEVVIRGLPVLLKNHPLFCGIALAGSGETVLLLENEKVAEFCSQAYVEGAQANLHPASELGNGSSRRALVVDDSLTARKSLVRILQQNGFATVEAGDGIEAIEYLHREPFDLVMTDLDMPRLGGFELLTDLQSNGYCDAPVVVVSSRDEEMFRSKAMDLGAAQYLPKPVSGKSIEKVLESLQLFAASSKG